MIDVQLARRPTDPCTRIPRRRRRRRNRIDKPAAAARLTATSEMMMMMRGSRWKKMIEEGSPGRERESSGENDGKLGQSRREDRQDMMHHAR